MSTISKEDYIKAIYMDQQRNGKNVSATFLSGKLNVSKAAVSDMGKKLANQGYIKYEAYKGATITKKGEKLALNLLRRHRLWEVFLMDVLKLDWGEVHEEAEKLEHLTSEKLIDAIDKYLHYPKFDPHGHPIPNKLGEFPHTPAVESLRDSQIKKNYRIVRFDDESLELMKYFSRLGISLYSEIYLSERLEFDDSVFIEIAGRTQALSSKIAERIFVTELEEQND